MNRRKRIGISLVGLALVLPATIFFVTRPRVPIEFPGTSPSGRFAFKEEFEGKPLVDWKLPGGHQFVYPKKRALSFVLTDPKAICGYFELDQPLGVTGRGVWLKTGDRAMPLQVAYADDLSRTSPSGTTTMTTRGMTVVRYTGGIVSVVSRTSKVLIPLPYATDEQSRDAILWIGNEEYDVRLPVNPAYSGKVRSSSVIEGPSHRIEVKAKPWLTSIQPLEFEFTSRAAPGVKLLTNLHWAEEPRARDKYITYGFGAMLLEPGKAQGIVVPRTLTARKLEGEIFELAESKVKLTAKRLTTGSLELYLPDGRCIYGKSAKKPIEHYGYKLLDVCGKLLSTSPYLQGTTTNQKFAKIKDGETLIAFGYKVKRKWKSTVELDTPPPLSDPPGSKFVFTYGASGVIPPRRP